MKSRRLFLAVLAPCLWASPPPAQAQTTAFTYQGRLSYLGQPANGSYDLTFTLADAPTNGSYVGPAVTVAPVPISNGLFSVAVDCGAAVFDGAARWLEIGVRTNGSADAYSTLLPRQAITAAPYAIFAQTAATLNGANLQPGSVNSNRFDAATLALFGSPPPPVDISRAMSQQYAIVTPYDCGAVGDGVTDDTAALQCWLDEAARLKLLAYLPPARGSFYKVDGTLYLTNGYPFNGVRILGSGGSVHGNVGDSTLTRCRLHKSSVNPAGDLLRIGYHPSPGTTPDNIWIEGVYFDAETFDPASRGIAFDGDMTNSDVNWLRGVGIAGFGTGLYLLSCANLLVESCYFGRSENDIKIPAGVVGGPTVQIRASSIGNARSNAIWMASGTALVEGCDLGSGDLGGFSQTHFLYCTNEGDATLRWNNCENSSSEPFILCTAVSSGGLVRLQDLAISQGITGSRSHSMVLTNWSTVLSGATLGSAASDGAAALISGDPANVHSDATFTAHVCDWWEEDIYPIGSFYRSQFRLNHAPPMQEGTLCSLRPDMNSAGHRLLYGARLSSNDNRTAAASAAYVDLLAPYHITATSANLDLNTGLGTFFGGTVRVNTGSGDVTITLPPASGCVGRRYDIKKTSTDSNRVIVKGNGSEEIDGQNTQTNAAPYSLFHLQSNGSGWDLL